MMRSHHLAFVLSGLFILTSMPIDAIAKTAAKKSAPKSGTYTDAGVKVTKNADGSVEVTDSGGSSAAAGSYGETVTQSPGGYTHTVTSRPAPPVTIKYGDGVVVKRNADGSCEVSDSDSGRMQSFAGGYVAPRRAVKRKTVRRKAK